MPKLTHHKVSRVTNETEFNQKELVHTHVLTRIRVRDVSSLCVRRVAWLQCDISLRA